MELTILMPCLNEAETIGTCIGKALAFLQRAGVAGEVLVADNGSTDGSRSVAEVMGARVVHVEARGYGAALRGGIAAARGRYIVMGDADDSYDFGRLDAFLAELRKGADLVMGNRFKGGIAARAMPFLHRRLGNPVLSFIGRLLFGVTVHDFHCGLRGFNAEAIRALDLRTPGMEFASELVVRSAREVQGRTLAAAAPAHLAGRVAAPEVSADLLAAVAVPLSRCRVPGAGRPGGGAAVSRAAPGGACRL
jgi:glycosyltransferase involved in cell wall biosynthesis